MVEIAVWNNKDEVTIESLGGNKLRIHVGTRHNLDDLEAALKIGGFSDYIDAAKDLYSDDQFERKFELQADFLLIRGV